MVIRLKNQIKNFDNHRSFEYDIDPTQRAWIEINGKSIEHNVRELKSKLKDNCQFMAVVKADGYGHDAKFVSENAIKGGASQLGVATLQEGISLRSFGINIPILVLGNLYTKKDLLMCLENDLMPTISSMRECLICNNIGKVNNVKFPIHLKVDTGMSRLGFEFEQFFQNFKIIKFFENINIKGIYSHLASADEENAFSSNSSTQQQRKKFEKLLTKLNIDKDQNITTHLSNSAGMLLGKDFHFDMVRVGLSMYGYQPSSYPLKKNFLKPALFLKSRVTFVRTIEKETGVSYGRRFISKRRTKLAVLSIGYADGILRGLSGNIKVLHNDKLYSQVGSITMDQMMVDITEASDIEVGSTMLLLGFEGEKVLSPLDWANKCNSITWEILCSFKNRLPRVKLN